MYPVPPRPGLSRGGCVHVCVCMCVSVQGLAGVCRAGELLGPPALCCPSPLPPAATAPVPSLHPLCPRRGSTGIRPLAAPSHSAKPCRGWGVWAAPGAPLCPGAPCEALEDGRSGMGELHLGTVGMWGPRGPVWVPTPVTRPGWGGVRGRWHHVTFVSHFLVAGVTAGWAGHRWVHWC